MEKFLAISCIIGVAYGASMTGNYASYDTDGSSNHASAGYGDDYGGKKCYPTYETKYKQKCEDYNEKVCYTIQNEMCKDVNGKTCQAIPSSKQERKCYDVTQLLCSLKQKVQYEEIPAFSTVQKCHNVKEQICDTVYETELSERDALKCIKVVNPYCSVKEHTVYDKTCRTLVHFDCKAQDYGGSDSYVSGGASDSYASGSEGTGGYDGMDMGMDMGMGMDSPSGGYGGSEYAPEPKCMRTYETKCYTTPRTVSKEYCEDREEKVCEKLTERVPVLMKKQNCHEDDKEVCELEQISQPKQMKKYVNTKHCRPVPKTVCENADQMILQPSCVESTRKECSYHPEEKCENVPKQHCYEIPYQVKKMECSESHASIGYESKSYGTEHLNELRM